MGKYPEWKDASNQDLKQIKMVCFDIDDTVTSDGKLTPESYSAMWDLKRAGFILMPITGRSAAWCDHFARFWPVDAVVGENGAFTFFMQDGVRRRIDTLGERAESAKQAITELKKQVLNHFPEAKWASDQNYREYDLAIDICEDVLPWPSAKVDELLRLCHGLGAHAKLSSIHVNAWFGNYDKCQGIRFWLESGAPGLKAPLPKWDEMIFIGDSPNDAPMFKAFTKSVGVANIAPYWDKLVAHPTWVTGAKSGDGFIEFSKKLISSRKS